MSQAGALVTTGGGGGSGVNTITGNSGVATPVANNINLVTANSTVKFVGSGNTITQDFGLSNLVLGASSAGITTAIQNAAVGRNALASITSATACFGGGFNALASLTTGSANVACGASALASTVTGINNVAVGSSALSNYTGVINAGGNIALGSGSLSALLTGQGNICIGTSSGSQYVSTEADNILINNVGVVGESHIIRIGIQGSAAGQQNLTYLVGPVLNGVNGTNSNPAWSFVNATNCGMLTDTTNTYITGGGFATLSVGFNISLSGGTNTITQGVVKSSINSKNTGFTTAYNEYFYPIDTSAGPFTGQLVSNPIAGQEYVFKDNTNTWSTNNFTLSGTVSGKNIDGATTFVGNTSGGSITAFYNGTQWNII